MSMQHDPDLAPAASQAATGRILLRHARLLDGTSAPRDGMSVAVEDALISAVADDAALASAPGDRVLDLAGRTLMPGLCSCHFHTTFENVSPVSAPSLGLHSPPAMLALVAAKNARIALACGVTSALCSSTAYAIDASLAEATEAGWMPGPRLLPGSHELMSTGDLATGASRNWYMDLGNKGLVRTADGADGFRGAVRDEVRQGARVVKLSLSQGHNAGPTTDAVSLAPEELEAAVETAHAHGCLVRAHAASKASILAAAHSGVDLIDHADDVDDECIEAILASGATVVPSAFYTARSLQALDQGAMEAWLPTPIPPVFFDTMQSMRNGLDNLRRMLPRMVEAGVDLVMGDDFGTIFLHHGEYAQELEFYVKEVGIDPLEALRWATRNGGRRMRRRHFDAPVGTIEVGSRADLLVVDGDPVADVTCLQDPARIGPIVRAGRFVERTLAG